MTAKNLLPIPPKEKLSKRIIVAFTEKDFNNFSVLCKKSKVTKSDLIRFFVNKLLYEQNKN
jgi:uncharacterized metal-binding protein